MRANIRDRSTFKGLQSASGLERIGDFYFIVADDSADLYRLDTEWNLVGTTPLFASDVPPGARIPKAIKPDLEAICLVEWQGKSELLCFGSGSKSPSRDVCYRLDMTVPASPQNVRAVPLTPLYAILRANAEILGGQKLNLEGATATRDALLLFQRGNISGVNAVMEYPLTAFMNYLDAPTSPAPAPHVSTYTLPQLKNRHPGFSAAITLGDSILFAASVEDTDSETEDGATLGSFIGLLRGGEIQWASVVEQNGEIAAVKIEGIAVLQAREDFYEIAGVTDNDADASELLHIEIA